MEENLDASVDSELGAELEESGVEAGESEAPQIEQDTTDWKAVAEAEAEKAKNYKLALTQKRQLRNTPPPVVEEEIDEDKPLTRREFQELFQSTVVPLVSASKEDDILKSKVTDPAKRAYVKQLLESRIVRTGTSDQDVENDIEEAIWMADRKKVIKQNEELRRAANNRPHPPAAGSSSEKPLEQKHYKWTAEQSRALEAKAQILGIDPEKFKKDAWENQKRTRTAVS